MSTAAARSNSGQQVELGRYEISGAERVLVGRRIDGVVHVYDWPRAGNARRYFVEAGFRSKVELALLIADYRRQAERLRACPMSRQAIERMLVRSPDEQSEQLAA